MKRGQAHSQVFVYILTVIITGAILIFGYNAVKDLMERSEQVEMANFKTAIKSDFETMSSDYGSVKTKTYNVPSSVKEICFYQKGDDPEFHAMPEDLNPLIADSVRDTDNNFFLVFGDESIDAMNLGKVVISEEDEMTVCMKPTGGRIKLALEGLGDGVSVGMA